MNSYMRYRGLFAVDLALLPLRIAFKLIIGDSSIENFVVYLDQLVDLKNYQLLKYHFLITDLLLKFFVQVLSYNPP